MSGGREEWHVLPHNKAYCEEKQWLDMETLEKSLESRTVNRLENPSIFSFQLTCLINKCIVYSAWIMVFAHRLIF